MNEYSEDTLLHDIQSQDEEALIVLHKQYANLVYSVAFHILNDPMGAEEVTQDVFMRLWKKSGDIDLKKGHLVQWLVMVTKCLAIDALRFRSRRTPHMGMVFMDEDPILWENILPEDGNAVPRRNLELALGEVPTEQRELIELAYFYNMSQRDIAETLEMPLGTVKTRIRLGMMKLRSAWHMPLEFA